MTSSVLVESEPVARKVLVDLDDLVVVLDRQKQEILWEFPPHHASHWNSTVASELIQALIDACATERYGIVAQIERSGGHMTQVEVSEEKLIQVQTVGRFSSPAYVLFVDEARRVVEAMSCGVRELGALR